MNIVTAVLIGFGTGISGTLMGGWFTLGLGSGQVRQSCLLGFSSGIMTAVVFFNLWPEAVHHGSIGTTILGSLLGLLIIVKFEPLMERLPWCKKRQLPGLIRLGLLLGIGIGVHNFPEGMALGTTYAVSQNAREWLGLAVLMAVHNIPEGMVMAAAFKLGKVKFSKIFLALLAVEIPMAIGGGVGAMLGRVSGDMVSLSLGFAGGAMIFLVGRELLPLARRMGGVFWVGSGFGLGMFLGLLLVKVTG